MRTNKFSIGWSIGVHVSSTVNEAIRTSLFIFFFYEKIVNAQKHVKSNKGNNFLRAQKLLRGWKSFAYVWVLFLGSNFFRKKKNKQAWNCRDNFIYSNTHTKFFYHLWKFLHLFKITGDWSLPKCKTDNVSLMTFTIVIASSHLITFSFFSFNSLLPYPSF